MLRVRPTSDTVEGPPPDRRFDQVHQGKIQMLHAEGLQHSASVLRHHQPPLGSSAASRRSYPAVGFHGTHKFIDLELCGKSLWLDPIHAPECEPGLRPIPDGFADEDGRPAVLVQRFQSRRQVHRCAEHDVVHEIVRSNVAHDGFADVQAKASILGRPTLLLEGQVELAIGFDAREHGRTSVFEVSVVLDRSVPYRHNGVADELVERSSVGNPRSFATTHHHPLNQAMVAR
jgi:hypothetical protein